MRRLSSSIIVALTISAAAWATAEVYTFRSAIERIGPGTAGVQSGVKMATLWHKLAHRFEYGKSADSFVKYLRESFEDFEFRKLHGSNFMTDRESGYRSVSLTGKNLSSSYRVDLTRKQYDRVTLRKLGDFGSEFALRENDRGVVGDRSYSAYFKSRAMLSHFSHATAGELVTGVQRIIDPKNLQALPQPATPYFRNLTGPSRKVADQYAREFPHVAVIANTYARIDALLKVKEHKGATYTHVRMVLSPRMKRIKKDFPDLHDYLMDLEGLLLSKITVLNKNGNRLATVYVDTKNAKTIVNVMTHNGRVVPFTHKNVPVFDEAFYFPDIRELTYSIDIDSVINVYGLHIKMWNVLVQAKYTNKDRIGKLNFHLARIPKPIIGGRFAKVIPPWMIDMGIPGSIDEYAHKFTKTLTKGNNGRGSRLHLKWDTRQGNRVIFTSRGETEFVDNRFIKFGAKVWIRKVVPDDDAVKDIQKVLKAATGALLKDLKQMAKT